MHASAVRLLLILLAALAIAAPSRAEPLSPGKGSFQFQDAKGEPGKPMTVWYYRPATLKPDGKVVFVMHGTERNGEEYRDHWAKLAREHGFLLLVPEFSLRDYPTDDYQFGGVRNPDPDKWTFAVVEHLFDRIKAEESLSTASYYLYGHSAGAQFVHRFMLFMPNPRVRLAISANAGSYTLPVYPGWTLYGFPWALDKSLVGEERLKSVFARPLLILLGEKDTDPNHKHLPRSREAKAQGENRFERGKYFYRLGQEEATRLGAKFNWSLKTVPGVGHSDSRMAKAAADYIATDGGNP